MKATSKAIYNILVNDNTLLSMLATNAPFYQTGGTKSKVNSIVPADIVERALETPFLVIQEGSEIRLEEFLKSETVFVRCYNDRVKSYIDINTILDKVQSLLHDAQISIDDRVLVRCQWETTLPGLLDESIGLKFKESRYRLLVL